MFVRKFVCLERRISLGKTGGAYVSEWCVSGGAYVYEWCLVCSWMGL